MEGIPDFSKKSKSEEFKKPAEFEFHQERFERADAEMNPISRYRARNDERGFTDAAFKEAGRDNAYFNKLHVAKENPETGELEISLTPEYKKSQEYLKVVFDNLKDKRDNPETSKTRGILYGMGAGMKIPYGIGEVFTLLETGVTAEVFDELYGASASALLMACMAMGIKSTLKGASIVCEDMATEEFIGAVGGKNMREGKYINLPLLQKAAEEGDKKFTEEEMSAMRAARAGVNFVVTLPAERDKELETRFLDAKTLPRLMDGVTASMSIDGLTGPIPAIDGVLYRDGAFDPLPIEKVIADYTQKHGVPPTDILVLANRPFETEEEFRLSRSEMRKIGSAKVLETIGQTLGQVPRLASLADAAPMARQAQKYFLSREALRQSIVYSEKAKAERGINVAIVWPPDMGLDTVSVNSDDMKAALFESRRKLYSDLGEKQPQEAPWYEPTQKTELKEAA